MVLVTCVVSHQLTENIISSIDKSILLHFDNEPVQLRLLVSLHIHQGCLTTKRTIEITLTGRELLLLKWQH